MQTVAATVVTSAIVRVPRSAVGAAYAHLTVRLAASASDVIAAQRLRYKVFCEEMGADLHRHDGRDVDQFDAYCEHLLVIDEALGKVVGTYRILAPWGARAVKRMYSEGEFRIDSLKPIAHEIFEVGRACIHPAYRNSGALARLWTGLGAYVRDNQVKYLAGCASVPLDSGSLNLGALRAEMMSKHLAPIDFRVEPIRGLQSLGDPTGTRPTAPPLLQGYLRLGAWVCGEPAWDPDFDSADFFVLLPIERMAPRYAQRFLGAHTAQSRGTSVFYRCATGLRSELLVSPKERIIMSSLPPNFDRRHALKFLAGVPMLPLTGASLASLLTGCGSDTEALPIAKFVSASFDSMAAPSLANAAAMATTTVASSLNVLLSDNTTQAYKLAYQPFFTTGDMVADGKGGTILSGGYFDISNKPIIDASVAGKERQMFSDSADGTSLLAVANPTVTGIKGKAVFAVVQFEYTTRNLAGSGTYGTLPSPIAVLTLDQDQTTGKLSLVKYHNVDTSKVNGLWITCGASLSPWGTHLSSEEYEPDAFAATGSSADKQLKAFSKSLYGDEAKANPYHYGHLPEVTVNADGTGTIKKHFCMGRISHELVQVMPDNRTVLMGDDATNSALFIFVADREKDLSSGTLYVGKLGAGFSIDPAAAGAPITWIKLGSATSAEIEAMANTLKAADIMTVLTTDPADATFTKIFVSGTANWIKVKPGMEKAAAFLETHRYAYLAGGSMGFTKMEGTTVNIKDKIAYSALQNMQDSMVVTGKGWNAASGIALEKAVIAGGVMAHTLTGGQKDTSGAAINSEWVPVQTKALLVGEDLAVADALGNLANADKISNPDNLKFSEKMRTLFIGEDSSTHVNNFLWAYNVDSKKLSRLMSMPSGAEATGLHVVDDLNGWTYIMSNFQHPGDWISGLHSKVQTTLDPMVRANYKDRFACAVGYLTADAGSPKLP